MKLKKIYMTLFVAAIFLTWLPSSAVSEKINIKWYSYQEGMEKIKKENKKGFLHFYTDWCTYCRLMNANTFTNEKVIAYLNENFIPMRVNADEQQDVAKKYDVDRFPNNFFLSEERAPIGKNIPGYIPADAMFDLLVFIHSNSYKTMTFNDYMVQKQAKKDTPPNKPNL